MQRNSIQKYVLGWFAVGALATIVGCAVGSDPADGVTELAATPVEAGTGDENSVSLPPSPHQGDDPDAGATDDDAGDTTDASTNVDAGSDGGGGGGGATCTSPNVCTGATDLGSISGDTGADTKTAQGSGSQWFKVRVTEDDSSVIGQALSVTADLTSPAGTNFNVFIYVAGGTSGQECSAVNASSTSTSTTDSARSSWGEGTFSNGSDDSRTVTVEVRWVSGTCSPTAKWSLTLHGDT
jgi:hypothetical protein